MSDIQKQTDLKPKDNPAHGVLERFVDARIRACTTRNYDFSIYIADQGFTDPVLREVILRVGEGLIKCQQEAAALTSKAQSYYLAEIGSRVINGAFERRDHKLESLDVAELTRENASPEVLRESLVDLCREVEYYEKQSKAFRSQMEAVDKKSQGVRPSDSHKS